MQTDQANANERKSSSGLTGGSRSRVLWPIAGVVVVIGLVIGLYFVLRPKGIAYHNMRIEELKEKCVAIKAYNPITQDAEV